MSKEAMATIAFAGYAFFMAIRDLAIGKYLGTEIKKIHLGSPPSDYSNYLWITFTTLATVLALSILNTLWQNPYGLIQKLRHPGTKGKVVRLGLFCGYIYLVLIFLISKLGPSFSSLLDYGLGPFVIAIFGWKMFGDKLTHNFFLGLGVCLIGLTFLVIYSPNRDFAIQGWLYVALAISNIVASAYSDGLKKMVIG